jgi:flavin-dependent dehydrogenase
MADMDAVHSSARAPTRFLILGGGTAGWMAALLLQRAFPNASLTLLESSAIGTIGVGEGSTPALKSFFDAVGIEEYSWMPACGATFKSGIRFDDWSRVPGFESYFHPFLTQFDRDHIRALAYNSELRRRGVDVHAHPDLYCYSAYLADRALCPVPPHSFPFDVQYGYHFDANRLAAFMKASAQARGVICRDGLARHVRRDERGDVSSVELDDGATIAADFFIDCSGFASVITKNALGISYETYSDALLNDRAVTFVTPPVPVAASHTTATALPCGWAWHIPQQERTGNGYVYSSAYRSEDQAASELAAHLGIAENAMTPRTLRFSTGRATTVWNRNTLAVGLAQGFLEPLEATALALVQLTLARFIRYWRAGQGNARYASQLNDEIADAYANVKDYLHTHYLTSNRDDSGYWRACRANGSAISPRLKAVIETWFSGGDIAPVLHETGLGRHYKLNSWLYLLSGMGIYPRGVALTPASREQLDKVPLASIRDFFERCTLNHLPQADALARLRAGLPAEQGAAATDPDLALERMLGLDFAAALPR